MEDRLVIGPGGPVVSQEVRETDQDVPLDLQALVEQCYQNGGYDADIDYGVALDPPLDAEDAAWGGGLLAGCGLR
jgi:hypothetical protein